MVCAAVVDKDDFECEAVAFHHAYDPGIEFGQALFFIVERDND